jgi:hypothetical protein
MGQRQLARLTDEELYADWMRWAKSSYQDLLHQGRSHAIFRQLRGMYEQNQPLRDTGSWFVQWAAHNYIIAASMSLRRELID